MEDTTGDILSIEYDTRFQISPFNIVVIRSYSCASVPAQNSTSKPELLIKQEDQMKLDRNAVGKVDINYPLPICFFAQSLSWRPPCRFMSCLKNTASFLEDNEEFLPMIFSRFNCFLSTRCLIECP